MANYFLCSFVFVLAACLFQQRCLHLVSADQALINSVCAKTGSNSRFCLDCFRNPGNQNLDIKGLAQNSISCASSASFDARQSSADLGKRSSGQFQQNCFTCVRQLDETLLEFSDATKSVGVGSFADAINSLNQANNRALNCLNLVGSAAVAGLATLKGDVDVAINVVNQIPK